MQSHSSARLGARIDEESVRARATRLWLPAALCLLGCQHAGGGTGELRTPTPGAPGGTAIKGQVAFHWRSGSDPSEGNMEVELPDGRRFHGKYIQPRATEWNTDYDVYWGAWTGPWGYARPWYTGPRTSFLVHYSGKALAHLEAPDATRMRCEFTLFRPDDGLAGGGQGACQLSTNEDVFDAVLVRE